MGPQGWVSPCRWVAPTERRLFHDKRSDNIIILHSVWESQKFNRWWWSFCFYNQEESTGRRVLSYTPHYFSGCPQSMEKKTVTYLWLPWASQWLHQPHTETSVVLLFSYTHERVNSTCSYLGDKEELLSAHHQCLHSQSLLLLMKSGNRLDIFLT